MIETGWMVPERWEHGSNFALPDVGEELGEGSVLHFAHEVGGMIVGSGRVALGLVVANGIRHRGWQRLWVPSYFCEDVVDYLKGLDIALERYPCGPWGEDLHPDGKTGDVLLRVNYFGWGIPALSRPFAGEIIEDHTHDPGSGQSSTADFVIASLRKVLPIPEGGLCWSPVGHTLPASPPLASAHNAAVYARLSAMALKRAYLSGFGDEATKRLARNLELSTETRLLAGERSLSTDWTRLVLGCISLQRAATVRLRNHQALKLALEECKALRLLGPNECLTPMVAVLDLGSRVIRDDVRAKLIESKIYPAVLWPLAAVESDILSSAAEYSSKVLMLHIDERYSISDFQFVAARVRLAIANAMAST